MIKYIVNQYITARTQKGVGERVDLDVGDVFYVTGSYYHSGYQKKLHIVQFGRHTIHLLNEELNKIAQRAIGYNDLWNELNA